MGHILYTVQTNTVNADSETSRDLQSPGPHRLRVGCPETCQQQCAGDTREEDSGQAAAAVTATEIKRWSSSHAERITCLKYEH